MQFSYFSSQKALITIIATSFVYALSIGMDFVIVPLMFTNHGLSKSLIGLLMGLEIAAAFCVAPFLPTLVRRVGMWKILIIATLLRNGILLLLPLYHGPLFWFPAMFFSGIGGFTLFISTQIWVNTLASDKRRGTALSAFTAFISLGIAMGPLILTFTGRQGFLPFLVSSIICTTILLPFYSVRSTLPARMEKTNINVITVIRKLPIPIMGGVMTDFIFFSMTSFLVLYGLSHGLTEARAALLITAMMIGGILVEIPVGWISDHVNRPRMVILCTVIILICSQLLPFAVQSTYAPWLLFTISSGAMGGIYTSSLALLAQGFNGKHLIAANSAFAMMNSIGGISGVVLTGLMMDIWGAEGLTYSIALACTMYFVICVRGRRVK